MLWVSFIILLEILRMTSFVFNLKYLMQNLVNFKLQEVFLESLEHFEQDS